MIFYTTIRIPNRPKRYARESQLLCLILGLSESKTAVPMIPQKKINKKDVHPPSSSNPLPSSIIHQPSSPFPYCTHTLPILNEYA